jgi:hypothetical protein
LKPRITLAINLVTPFYANVVSQHIQLFGLIKIAIYSCCCMHRGLLDFDVEFFTQCIHVFQTPQVVTSEEVTLKFVSVGKSVGNCHFFQCVFNMSVFFFILTKLLLFIIQLSIDVYQNAVRTYLFIRKLDYMNKVDHS